jgi:DNA-binding protein H-NS
MFAPAESRLMVKYDRRPSKRIKMATLQELLDQKAALDRQIAEAQRSSRATAVAQIKALMAEHGLTLTEVTISRFDKKSAKTTGSKVPAKYRDPQTGASWSGRGLKPRWLTEELSRGKSISDFAV